MSDVRTPAQAAYEAWLLGDDRAPAFDQLPTKRQEVWRHVANAAVTAVMLCDDIASQQGLRVGQRVVALGRDYTFEGQIVVVFAKRSGAVRLVVEDDRGLLLIMDPDKVRPADG